MTVVYLDALFLLNLIINYLLLLATAKVAGERLCRWRVGVGAALGALYASAIFLPGWGFLIHPAVKLAVAVGMVLIAFGGSRRLLRLNLVFFAISAAFGGGIYALQLLGGQGLSVKNGVFTSVLDLRVILLSAAGCYCVITLIFSRAARHTARELVPCTLEISGKTAKLTALIDTGNTLTDPVRGGSVLVAEGARIAPLLGEKLDLSDPVGTLSALHHPKRFCLLPYQAIGVSCGMLLCVWADSGKIGEKSCEHLLVGLSPTPVSDGGGYQALIGQLH
ncbi:MAG: sigma-E processing peptidase SpoIIGA [Oscillospiraceae bacterium]